MVTLRQLQHALALAEHGNFHAAARAVHLSQPALSRSIKALESQLGATLFDRGDGGVQPTVFGRVLLSRARTTLGETDELLREIRLLKGLDEGRLTLGLGVYAAEMSANRAAGELMSRHPGLELKIRLTNWADVRAAVETGEVELGVAEISEAQTSPELTTEPVGQHRMILFCRHDHPLAGRAQVNADDLAPYPTVAPRLPGRVVDRYPGKTRIDPVSGHLLPSIEVDDFSSARLVVSGSHAFGTASPIQIEPWLARGELQIINFSADWLQLNYGFIYRRNRMLSPAAKAYMALVRNLEAQVSAENDRLLRELSTPDGTD